MTRRRPFHSSLSPGAPFAPSLILLFILFSWGCGGGDRPERVEGEPLRVVSTIGMITDLVERIGGDRVSVQGLMGPGVDPHLYRAGAGDLRALTSADLVLYNGLFLEAALGEVLEEMGDRVPTRAVTADIPRDRLLAPQEFEGSFDPHVWSDVSLWRIAAGTILNALLDVDPEGEAHYRERHTALDAEMEELDAWVREEVARIPADLRVLVTAHDAFNYFGRAYDVEVRGLQGLSTVTEAGAADVQELAAFLLEREIPALFVESSIPTRTVEAVRRAVLARGGSVEIGGTLYSDAMGSAGTPEGTYAGMVRHNVTTIVGALGGAR
ncbi:MAG: manganese transporter [Gemmatimonadales bacterium]|nr:MAG: manganese transporter [Gemmatimonadales bacterium]